MLRPEALKDYPAELSLESPLGSFSVPVDRAANVAEPYDVLWITVKATQLDSALRSVTVDPGPDWRGGAAAEWDRPCHAAAGALWA